MLNRVVAEYKISVNDRREARTPEKTEAEERQKRRKERTNKQISITVKIRDR